MNNSKGGFGEKAFPDRPFIIDRRKSRDAKKIYCRKLEDVQRSVSCLRFYVRFCA